MPWPTTSTVQALDVHMLLQYHVNGFILPQVAGAMDRTYDQAEAILPGQGARLVTKVEQIVTKINSYDAQIDADAANAGLKKADVLEWFGSASSSGKLAGLRQERSRQLQWLADLLGLENDKVGSQQGRLIR